MTIGPDHAAHLVPERRALADDVHDVILGLLMDHRIEPGAKVSIDGIARDFDVSPTPVREALARLESEGLVVKRALRGYTAAPLLDAEGLRKLFEMRRILEPAGTGLAAARMTPATVAALEELAGHMRASASSSQDEGSRYQDHRDFADQDARFHRIIAEHSGNDLLADAIVRLRSSTPTPAWPLTSTTDAREEIVTGAAPAQLTGFRPERVIAAGEDGVRGFDPQAVESEV